MMEQRKHPRLKGYDYSQGGAYFVTFCTKERKCVLSAITVGRDAPGAPGPTLKLTDIGKSVEKHILRSEQAYPGLRIDQYVIMPNHVHILFTVEERRGAPRASRPTELVPRMVAAIKRFSNQDAGQKLWQTSFYDHVIRDEADYLTKWNYIAANPAKWAEDEYYQ